MITANLDESYLHRLDNLYLVAEKGERRAGIQCYLNIKLEIRKPPFYNMLYLISCKVIADDNLKS